MADQETAAPPTFVIDDCCVQVHIAAEPVLVLAGGDVDPFTGEEVGWPFPVVYWSNGTVTAGAYERA